MRLPRLSSGDSLELKMTPMIDVVFLLLVFFVWTSSFEIPEFDLPSAIAEPPAGGSELSVQQAPVEAFDEIVIRLTTREARTVIELNGQPLADDGELRRRLEQILALGVQPPVIIDPSPEITMNEAVNAYDTARLAGADRVLFAARAEE